MQKNSTWLLSQFSSNYNSNYRRIPFFRITEENRKPSTHWMGWFSSPPSSCSYAGTLLFARTERRVITRVFTCTHAHTQAHIRANVWNARLRAASSAVILTTLQPLCRPHACKPRMKSVRRSEREKRAGFTPRCPWRRLPPTTFLYFSPYTSASCFIPKNSIVLRFPPSSPRPSRGRAEPVPPPRRDVSSVEARPSRRRSHPRFVPRCASRYAAIRYTGLSVDLVSPCRSRLREESNHPRRPESSLAFGNWVTNSGLTNDTASSSPRASFRLIEYTWGCNWRLLRDWGYYKGSYLSWKMSLHLVSVARKYYSETEQFEF